MDVERKSTSTSAPRAVTGISDRHWPVKETQLNGLTLARLDTDVTVKFPSACGGAEEEEQNGNKKKERKKGGGGEGMRFHFTIHQPHLDFFFFFFLLFLSLCVSFCSRLFMPSDITIEHPAQSCGRGWIGLPERWGSEGPPTHTTTMTLLATNHREPPYVRSPPGK